MRTCRAGVNRYRVPQVTSAAPGLLRGEAKREDSGTWQLEVDARRGALGEEARLQLLGSGVELAHYWSRFFLVL